MSIKFINEILKPLNLEIKKINKNYIRLANKDLTFARYYKIK